MALKQADGNQSEAAKILGVSRVTIWNRMKKFGIKLPQ
jgi:transcriptional regulator of acetoin/glycerol metabolism